jgi:hypothetical protein
MMFMFRPGDHFHCLDRFQEIRAYPSLLLSWKTKAKRRQDEHHQSTDGTSEVFHALQVGSVAGLMGAIRLFLAYVPSCDAAPL